jgi:hypothetical protein
MDAANSELGAGAKPGKKRGSASELRQRLDAAKEITMLFKMERYVYMACCGMAVLLLFYCAFRLLQTKGFDPVVIGSLFGSGGLITFSTGRLIFMWNKILEIILMEGTGKGDDDDGDK